MPDGATVTGELVGPDDTSVPVEVTGPDDAGEGRASYTFDDTMPVGELDLVILVDGTEAGRTTVFHNMLDATLEITGTDHEPGDPIEVTGTVEQVDASSSDLLPATRTGVPASFTLQARGPDGQVQPAAQPVTANGDGTFTAVLPSEATVGLSPEPGSFTLTAAVEVVDATYDDAGTPWAAAQAGVVPLEMSVPPDALQLDTSFASSTGWVRPGDAFPFRVTVTNVTGAPVDGAQVTMTAPPSVTFTDAVALRDVDAVSHTAGAITWDLATVAAGTPETPTVATLVVEAQAADLTADPEVVWKDLSVAADLAVGAGHVASSATHGPKVVPPDGRFDTARYGDKPFPIVPVDYVDRQHAADHTGEQLSRVVNSPDVEGSTFNLYQEMSFGQLFPIGSVPSSGIATADFSYDPGFQFSSPDLTKGTCRGATMADLGDSAFGTPLYPSRIVDGWYQLPGTTEYYGGDYPAFTLGTGSTIDAACGPTGKSVFDAAAIADPEIDYDDFDSDKDGVVDFFMMVFTGLGGNGDSQVNGTPPYDNIWPHSSSLELEFADPDTGLRGLRLRRPAHLAAQRPAVLDLRGPHELRRLPGRRRHRAGQPADPRPRRPVQRQPRVGDRRRQRHQPRVRPPPRPAGLLLRRCDRQPLLRLHEPHGGRLQPAHDDLRQAGARLGRPGGPAARRRGVGHGLVRGQAGHGRHPLAASGWHPLRALGGQR